MGDLVRSEDMSYVNITFANDAAVRTVRALARDGNLHLVDLSSKEHPSKEHMAYKKRAMECTTWLGKLKTLHHTATSLGLEIPDDDLDPAATDHHEDVLRAVQTDINHVLQYVRTTQNFLRDNAIAGRKIEDHIHTLRVTSLMPLLRGGGGLHDALFDGPAASDGLQGQELQMAALDSLENGIQASGAPAHFRNVLAGVILASQEAALKRMLYRVTRGNCLMEFTDVEEAHRFALWDGDDECVREVVPGAGDVDDENGVDQHVNRCVFTVVLLGQEILPRAKKACEAFAEHVWTPPTDSRDSARALELLRAELRDKQQVQETTREQLRARLRRVVGADMEGLRSAGRYDEERGGGRTTTVREWEMALRHEVTLCGALMKAHFHGQVLSLEGWCPSNRIPTRCVGTAVSASGLPSAAVDVNPVAPLAQPGTPPTYIPTSTFASAFQGIVDTYGVPRYGEINPGRYTIVTFPFMFGVMYGDVGHGLLLTLAALWMLWQEKRYLELQRKNKLGEIFSMVFGGRYLLVLMGAFGVYCGLIYNDCMANAVGLFSSRYSDQGPGQPMEYKGGVYPFGVDSAWYEASNHLAFFNSMKMKMSVTIGVGHMLFGLYCAVLNHRHFGDAVTMRWELIPRVLFLTCTFGYMVLLILIKWCIDWSATEQAPPNLIQTMILMFLSPGTVPAEAELYSGQAVVQSILLLIAVLSVPVMLLGKPLVLRAQARARGIGKPPRAVRRQQQRQGQGQGARGGGALGRNSAEDDELSAAMDRAMDLSLALERKLDAEEEEERKSAGEWDDDESMSADDDERGGLLRRRGGGGGGGGANGNNNSKARSGSIGGDAGHAGGGAVYFDFQGELIHQSIHTIEFVLGCVSNTASYLRLWALSLAHAQLAEVFWTKLIGFQNPIAFIVGAWFWACATFFVLLCMDTLECFLHALRLHWVEFQNKFYYADGYAFEPLKLDSPLDQ